MSCDFIRKYREDATLASRLWRRSTCTEVKVSWCNWMPEQWVWSVFTPWEHAVDFDDEMCQVMHRSPNEPLLTLSSGLQFADVLTFTGALDVFKGMALGESEVTQAWLTLLVAYWVCLSRKHSPKVINFHILMSSSSIEAYSLNITTKTHVTRGEAAISF